MLKNLLNKILWGASRVGRKGFKFKGSRELGAPNTGAYLKFINTEYIAIT